ncbi:MAG: hypothetical protein ACREUI_05675 [Burkholderiales bacterium]
MVEARQGFDIPPLRHEVTELPESSQCVVLAASCIGVSFPRKLRLPLQYGPRIQAAVVHLTCPIIGCRWHVAGL